MKKIVALFPGQGSQHVGMGKDLVENFKIAKETFEEASDAIGLHLTKLCFDGPESDLVLTENTQPALLTTSIAAFRVAEKEFGFEPALVAGHSLGEYSALVANGALPLPPAVRWVRERGAAMQKAVPAGQGGMAAVMGMEDAQIEKLCQAAMASATAKRASGEVKDMAVDCVCSPANFNAPGQTVIAGSADAIAEAVALIKAGGDFSGGKAIPLAVSAPFHCALMAPARSRMADLFSSAPAKDQPKQLNAPYVPNRTARITSEPSVVFELLVDQVDHEVRWRQSVTAMLEQGFETYVEFGPGKVLQGLMKRIAGAVGKPYTASGVNDVTSLQAFGTLWKG